MTISYKLLSLAILGAGAAVGGGYFLIGGDNNTDHVTKTIGSRLGESLILSSEDVSKWEARLSHLKEAKEDSLVDDLKEIKNNDPTSQKVKDWCVENASSPIEDDKRFSNVRSFCTYRIRDKLSKAVRGTDDPNWEQASLNVKIPSAVILSPSMQAIKEKLASEETPNAQKILQDWCSETLEVMYANDSTFKDADSYCTTDDE
ncbi:hypothetical protein HF1_05830 [Mycoplasma haemofelis str. Langford 1]|uniref:Uncharacterized protein n=1 Tax=Mycoplasma haemofelis (strain Langford 1) TaxID=941640 RepID=E8ZHH0_MYCHL|nr:hypothetical protein [Mycoplasma haemofelis]CBY92591.1 hypothetical protein HF1_05830 [Mycoplasma haemofelis str. Langford 1]